MIFCLFVGWRQIDAHSFVNQEFSIEDSYYFQALSSVIVKRIVKRYEKSSISLNSKSEYISLYRNKMLIRIFFRRESF